jgi:hypothetical protein
VGDAFVEEFFAGGVFAESTATVDNLLFGAGFSTVRYFLIFSSLFGPMPRMACNSSTLLNVPKDFRAWRILSAVEGPMPGTCWSSSALAVFKLTGCRGGFFFAQRSCVAQSTRIVKRKQKLRAVLVLHPVTK